LQFDIFLTDKTKNGRQTTPHPYCHHPEFSCPDHQADAKATFFIKGKHFNEDAVIMNPNILRVRIFISRTADI
jgi:zona occludens toxin (predicted ATPase)